MRTILIVAALVFAIVLVLLGFDVFSADGDPHLFGWLGLSLACWFGAHLVSD